MIRPEHQFYIRPDLRKAASTKAESTTAESAIRPKQLVRINQCQKISYPVQKLRENNVEGIDIMQISGHKNVAFINNYSALSEERHMKISNILSNTESETNRNALVPVQFSANLPRKPSTNSTASSTSDVSSRSNPDVPSYSSNTNMSSQISSMFNGVVIHN